jgi:hypothetical protein
MSKNIAICEKVLRGVGADTDDYLQLVRMQRDDKAIILKYDYFFIAVNLIELDAVQFVLVFEYFTKKIFSEMKATSNRFKSFNRLAVTRDTRMVKMLEKLGFVVSNLDGEKFIMYARGEK